MMKFFKKLQDRMATKGDEGFTLIELLIVIVVLGILAAVVVFALSSVNHNAKQSACNADAKTVETAVSAYNAQFTPSIAVEKTIGAGSITVGTPASYSAGAQAALLLGQGLVKSWPGTANGYAVSLSTDVTKPGDVAIYIPPTSLTAVDFESETSSTGCNDSTL